MAKRIINFIVAPEIPNVERIALEQHVKNAIDDPGYVIVANYETRWGIIRVEEGDQLLAVVDNAPFVEMGINPEKEMEALRKKLDDPTISLIVVNYEARLDTFHRRMCDRVLCVAPGVLPSELMNLRAQVDAGNSVVVNYGVCIDIIPAEELR